MTGITAEEIYRIFSELFGGRKSPFTLHSLTLSGKAVYRRACKSCRAAVMNRFDCARCMGGVYRAISAEDIFNHINGKAAAGIYPADENGLCRFSVVEIRRRNSAELLASLSAACDRRGITHACEMCSYGAYARLWIFFDHDISASSAVRAAMRVVAEAAAADGLELFSLLANIFPSMGGFGKPVVLPLFDISAESSYFVDKNGIKIEDSLGFLADIKARTGDFSAPVPTDKVLEAESCGSLYVSADRLSLRARAELCLAASFPNLECAEFSAEPTVCNCFTVLGDRLVLPPKTDVKSIFPKVKIRISDGGAKIKRLKMPRIDGWQKEAYLAAEKSGGGLITAPLGSGKTAVVLALLAKAGSRFLILVPDRSSAKRWRERICSAFSLDEEGIGLVLDDGDSPTGCDIAVAGEKTAFRLAEYLPSYGIAVVADCDRLSCMGKELRSILEELVTSRIYAISAREVGARLGDYVRLYIGETL